MDLQTPYIAVNGKSFANAQKGGALRASLRIINALQQIYQENQTEKHLVLLIPTVEPIPKSSLLQDHSIEIIFFVNPLYKYALFRNLWEQFILSFYVRWHRKYKVVLNLTNSLSIFSVLPQILLIHDVGFLNEQWFNILFSKYLKYIINYATRKRDIEIVTVSQSSANQLWREFPKMLPPKIICNGYDPITVASHSKLYSFDYILFIGSINPRKNLMNLLEAFKILKSSITQTVKLVVIGHRKKIFQYNNISENITSDVIYLGYVEDEVKWSILRHAQLLVLVSFLEGFGLPILEAFSVGTPVVASDIPVFHELYHSAIQYVDPHRPDDIAQGIQSVLESAQQRERLIHNGYQVLTHFSWTKAAYAYNALIDEILS